MLNETESPHDWAAIRSFYDAGNTAKDCRSRFGVSKRAWYEAVRGGEIVLHRVQVAKPHGETRSRVATLLGEGLRAAEIARRLGVSKPTVAFHMRRLGVPPIAGPGRRYDWAAIREFYEAGHSAHECRREFGFGRNAWADAVARGAIRPRPRLEPLDSILAAGRRRSRHHVKLRLLDAGLKQARCEDCGLSEWLGGPLSLELHHVNGDGTDNRLENLMLLCPNCHSQTSTWGGRNKGRTRDAATARGKGTRARASRPPPVWAAAVR